MLTFNYYKRPNGIVQRDLPLENIDEEDEKFFVDGKYEISMEVLTNEMVVVYARHPSDQDGDDELLELDRGRSCQETMKALRAKCEKKYG